MAKIPFRVIDTPGLQDTNRSVEDIAAELHALRLLSPHGVSASILCVPMGRVTEEHERALKDLSLLFGEQFLEHACNISCEHSIEISKGGKKLLNIICELP